MFLVSGHRIHLIPAELGFGNGVDIFAAVRGIDIQTANGFGDFKYVPCKRRRIRLLIRLPHFIAGYFHRFAKLCINCNDSFVVRIRPRKRKGDLRETASYIADTRRQRKDLLNLDRALDRIIGVNESEVRGFARLDNVVNLLGIRRCSSFAGFIPERHALDDIVGIPFAGCRVVEGQLGCIRLMPILIVTILAKNDLRIALMRNLEPVAVAILEILPDAGFDRQRSDSILSTYNKLPAVIIKFRYFIRRIPIHAESHRRQFFITVPGGRQVPQLLAVDGIAVGQRIDEGVVRQQGVPRIGISFSTRPVIVANAIGHIIAVRPFSLSDIISCICIQIQRNLTECIIFVFVYHSVTVADDIISITTCVLHRLIVIIAGVHYGTLDSVVLDLKAERIVLRHSLKRHRPDIVCTVRPRGGLHLDGSRLSASVRAQGAYAVVVCGRCDSGDGQGLHFGLRAVSRPLVVFLHQLDLLFVSVSAILIPHMNHAVNVQIDIRAQVIVIGERVAPLLVPFNIHCVRAGVGDGQGLLVEVVEVACFALVCDILVICPRIALRELRPEFGKLVGILAQIRDLHRGCCAVLTLYYFDPNLFNRVLHDLSVARVFRQAEKTRFTIVLPIVVIT